MAALSMVELIAGTKKPLMEFRILHSIIFCKNSNFTINAQVLLCSKKVAN